jgi:arsenate reductase
MNMTIYGIKNCNTMQKAFKLLNSMGIEYTFHNYKESGITKAKLNEWFAKIPWEQFINKRGPAWRTLDEAVNAYSSST